MPAMRAVSRSGWKIGIAIPWIIWIVVRERSFLRVGAGRDRSHAVLCSRETVARAAQWFKDDLHREGSPSPFTYHYRNDLRGAAVSNKVAPLAIMPVARFLSAIFPDLKRITTSRDGLDNEDPEELRLHDEAIAAACIP
ncbi:hypothetical protein DFH08DRAFT_804184 [Mycena albidolilacea]|uniref:Uncharacterized protein n=1 Tax=Mycena albidolilacea TaxID=1033008 RepID=A0AAD7ABM5_9AGAR|nr:hypothetical protein DFH08DRAFT_804184 [Mycena albidolilacea]